MSYFYGKTAAVTYAKCITLSNIEKEGGSVEENKDGTVSVYIPTGPIFLRKDCCERLNPSKNYYFDINTQKCRWTTESNTCSLDNIKVTLNPEGNDGTIFYTDSVDEVCTLNIDFDYLFKVSCGSLNDVLNGGQKTQQQLDAEIEVRKIQFEVTKTTADCEAISKQIKELNYQISATSYSIKCSQNVTIDLGSLRANNLPISNFSNTGFNPMSPFGFDLENYVTVTLCLTDTGLNVWQNILGTDAYNMFLNGDASSYTCVEFNNIKTQNDTIVKNNTINNTQTPELVFECTTPFGTKTQLYKNLNILNEKQAACKDKLDVLLTELTASQAALELLEPITCSKPIDTLETLDISIGLDVTDASGKTTTIATYPLLSPIGNGNLYTYLVDNADNSGFLICGDPTSIELSKGITGCTPMQLNDTKNVFVCGDLLENIKNDLYTESTLIDRTEFDKSLNNDVFASKWLHHSTIIDDQTIISDIINKKIKLSVTINHSCSDFCVLMDNIQLNKTCQLVTEKNMFIAQPPSFELERIIDNKKSWVSNTSFVNRTFRINNESNVNPIRLTDYDVNDERLVINTKEIDLDISIASGIETDVWCYISDNPCLLTALTETNNCDCITLPCFKDSFEIIDFVDSNYETLNDIEAFMRSGRDNWAKLNNERYLAVGPVYTIKDSPYSVYVNPDIENVREATTYAYRIANIDLSKKQSVYINGVTPEPNVYQYINEPPPQIVSCDCGDLMVIKDSDYFIYVLSNNDNELEIYVQDITGTIEPKTRLVSLNKLLNEGNPTGIKGFSGTSQIFCSSLGGIVNSYSNIKYFYPAFETNDNVEIKDNSNTYDYTKFFTTQWDSTKNKCMAKTKDAFPEAFSVNMIKQDYQTYCKHYANPNPSDYNQCVADFIGDITYQNNTQINYLGSITGDTTFSSSGNYTITNATGYEGGGYIYGDGITYGAQCLPSDGSGNIYLDKICTLTLTNVVFEVWDGPLGGRYLEMNTKFREFKDLLLLHNYNRTLTRRLQYVTATQDINGVKPFEPFDMFTSEYIYTPVDVTTTIRKGSIDGPIAYQESYRLNDPSLPLSSLGSPKNLGSLRGLSYLMIPIGVADVNGFQYNTIPNDYNQLYSNKIPFGNYITGSTAGMPFFNSGDNTNPAMDFKDKYYVHLDIIDTSGNTYYATNNDFNLNDSNGLIKFPTTASTQTFNINDALNSIEDKKQEFLDARDFMVGLITKNGYYINQ